MPPLEASGCPLDLQRHQSFHIMRTQLFSPQYMEICLFFPFNWCLVNKSEQRGQKKNLKQGLSGQGQEKWMNLYVTGYRSWLLGLWRTRLLQEFLSFLRETAGVSVCEALFHRPWPFLSFSLCLGWLLLYPPKPSPPCHRKIGENTYSLHSRGETWNSALSQSNCPGDL